MKKVIILSKEGFQMFLDTHIEKGIQIIDVTYLPSGSVAVFIMI